MATMFKRSRRKNEPYTIQYRDHKGKRRTVKGFTDKGLSEELAKKLESETRMRTTGLVDPEQESYALAKRSPIEEHLSAFSSSLADNSDKHVKLTMHRAKRVIMGCHFQSLGEIAPEPVRDFLRQLREEHGIGHRTYNHYLQACESFLNWCVATKRLLANPLAGMERLNNETDVRHQRRALSPEEVAQLISAAASSKRSIQCQSPAQRVRIYTVAYLTGLRKREIASLTLASFRFDDDPPTLTIAASRSKHRKKDTLPLHPDLVAKLRVWTKGMKPTDKLFPGLERKKLSLMIQKDLSAAGIPYETADGIADFHAAGRHSYITQLIRSGVSLPTAMGLARHSDVKMTMRYTHIGIDDQATALAHLPLPTAVEPADALQMRCISGVSGGHLVSPAGSEPADKKRQNPCSCKGFVTDEHGLSPAGKAEGTGVEPATPCGAPDFESDATPRKTKGKRGISATRQQIASSNPPVDADLQAVMDAWPTLPEPLRAGILAMVKGAMNTPGPTR